MGENQSRSSEQDQEQYQVQLFKISWGVYLYNTRLRCWVSLLFGTDVDWPLWSNIDIGENIYFYLIY